MPVYFAIAPWVEAHASSGFMRSAIFLTVCLPGLALFSEGVRRIVRPVALRDRVFHSVGEYSSSHIM